MNQQSFLTLMIWPRYRRRGALLLFWFLREVTLCTLQKLSALDRHFLCRPNCIAENCGNALCLHRLELIWLALSLRPSALTRRRDIVYHTARRFHSLLLLLSSCHLCSGKLSTCPPSCFPSELSKKEEIRKALFACQKLQIFFLPAMGDPLVVKD